MESPTPFYLNNLAISHHRSPMKIGTDGVLLGAYPKPIKPNDRCLDIGSGCGIITLMTATAYPLAHYTCLDIDQNATIECSENIINNALSEICDSICCDLKEFRSEGKYYDVIYSNPPFYNDDMKPIDDKKRAAKHIDSLNFEELINSVKVLLKKSGYFIIILPERVCENFISIVDKIGLKVQQRLFISSYKDSNVIREILTFQFLNKETNVNSEHLFLYNSAQRNDWSEGYKKMLRAFKQF